MWIKFVKPKKGKPIFELGERRKKNDPVVMAFKELGDAVRKFKEVFRNETNIFKR